VLLTTAPREALIDFDGIGGNWYDKTDTYMAWTCALPVADRLSVTCPPTGLNFLKANVPDVEVLEYPTWADYLGALRAERWDMVGVSCYTWSAPVAVEMAKMARAAGVQEVWAGNYGALTPGLETHFDRLVKGPGEAVLHEYVYGRPLAGVRHPPMLGRSSFRGVSSGVGYLYSKRGCNIGCSFCSTPVFNPRENPIDAEALDEALDRYQAEKVAHVIIYDETFFLDNALAEQVIDALARRGLPWICLTRADRIRGRVGELTDRGMDGAIIGVESFRDYNLADVRKRDDVYNVRATIREMHRYGRRVLGTFIIGFERDDAETISADLRQLAQEGIFACQLTILTPFHGTRLYKEMEPVLTEPDLTKFDLYHLVWRHPKITPDEMRKLLAWGQRTVNDPERIATRVRADLKDKMLRTVAARCGHAELPRAREMLVPATAEDSAKPARPGRVFPLPVLGGPR
jgi:pyruvate-formate lyase-activating enzyme